VRNKAENEKYLRSERGRLKEIDELKDLVIDVKMGLFILKSTRCSNFTDLFWHEALHVSDSSYKPV
jgi:hypothetical protein